MKNLIPNFITGVVVAFVLVAAYACYDYFYKAPREAKEMAYWRDKAFTPDTTIIEKYTNTVRGHEYVPPATVNYYQTTDDSKNNRILKLLDSALEIIDTLTKQKNVVSDKFLKQYPTANKLISGKFTKDTLQLDLLSTDGQMKSQIYHVDYSGFSYYVQDNSVRATQLNTRPTFNSVKKTPFVRYDGMYANYEQGFIIPTKTAEATIGIDIWKVRAQGFARYNIYNPDQSQQGKFNAGLKIGFKF